MEQNAPIYVPGDQISLEIEIEHVQNFTEVYADFMRRPEQEDEGALPMAIPSRRIYPPHVHNDDGSKVSEVELEAAVDPLTFVPGVYELRRVRGKTVRGQMVEFDVDERLKELRFRYAPEPPAEIVPRARPVSPPTEGT